MDTLLVAVLLCLMLVLGLALGWFLRRAPAKSQQTHIHSNLDSFRAIGELSVFKALTKEIVTSSDHAFGQFGEKYLSWAFTKKKLVMIFSFEVDFRFNFKRNDFTIDIAQLHNGTRKAHITMPPCTFELAIKDVQFYDEQKSKLLPWLLPDLVSGFVDGGFSEDDKNRLLGEARAHAAQAAEKLVIQLRPDVERSARSTMQALAAGFDVQFVEVHFSAEQGAINLPSLPAVMDVAASSVSPIVVVSDVKKTA